MPQKKLVIILTSHRKPKYLEEAINSVLTQTRKDYVLLLVDSGDWKRKKDQISLEMKKIFENLNPEIQVIFTRESKELKKKVWMHSRVLNKIIELKIIKTPYVSFLCDDDLIYPQYVEEMLGMLETGKKAVYCSENRVIVKGEKIIREKVFLADEVKSGSVFDCKIDYLQVMFETKLFDELEPPWFSEHLANKHHADGIFLNRLGAIVKVYPVKKVLCENRITPISVNNPSFRQQICLKNGNTK